MYSFTRDGWQKNADLQYCTNVAVLHASQSEKYTARDVFFSDCQVTHDTWSLGTCLGALLAISLLVRALCSRRLKQPHTMQVTEDDDPESRGRLAPHEL